MCLHEECHALSRLVNQPITVVTDDNSLPSRFVWRQRWHNNAGVLEEWRDTGCWWEGEGEKAFYLLQTDNGGTYELYFDFKANCWYLYRVLD